MDEQQGETPPATTKTTLAERGPLLPIGILGHDGKRHQDIAVRPWRMKEERALGRRREQNTEAGDNFGKYVSVVLSMMCTKLGTNDWSEMKTDNTSDRELVVSQMWMPDVFYAYCWLRLASLKPTIPMTLISPHAPGTKFDFEADIRTLEVVVPSSLDACMWEYTLNDPITLRSKRVTKLVLGPQRWSTVERIDDTSMGTAKATVIASSIHQLPGAFVDAGGRPVDVMILDDELDEMSKLDLETLTDEINKRGVGPILKVDAVCPKTKKPFEAAIDWRFDRFFGIGSQ
jgi:hypothetical protein